MLLNEWNKNESNVTVCQFPFFFWEIVKTYEVRGTELSFCFSSATRTPLTAGVTDRHDKDVLVQKFWKLKLSSGYMKDRIHENFVFFDEISPWSYSEFWKKNIATFLYHVRLHRQLVGLSMVLNKCKNSLGVSSHSGIFQLPDPRSWFLTNFHLEE